MDDEPEVQHRDECEHPSAPCTCPRDHLLAEARRIREMCLFAESEFARENERAVSLKIERDRLRVIVERAHDYVALDEGTLRSLDVDGLVELVGVLRRDYIQLQESVTVQTAAADAAGEAVGSMAEKLSATLAANAILQERDQDWERYCTNQALIDAGKVVWLEARVRQLEEVTDAAIEFVAANRAWIAKAKEGQVRSTDDESHRRAAAVATLGLRVDDLPDASPTGEGT